MGFVKVNDLNLHYKIRGSGPRLLFIHGIGADLRHPISIFNTAVPEHFTVLAFDPRGLGESDVPNGPYTMADMADDAVGLAAALGWSRYHVLGASMGGMVAQEVALRHPEVVEKLVLAVTNAGRGNGAPVVIDRTWNMSTLEQLRTSDIRQDEAWVAANPEAVRQMEQGFQAAKAALQADPKAWEGWQRQVQAVLEHDAFDRLHQIQAETLVFNGRFDGSQPPEVPRAMAARLPHARFELVEHGHGSWYFDPSVWDMVIEFLND